MKKEDLIRYGEIINRCWEDEEYKSKFLQDPESLMLEKGITLEEGVTYKVIEAPKNVQYIVLSHDKVKENVQDLTKGLLNSADTKNQILPEGVELRIIQNTDELRHLILPASPKTMTAAELAGVTGGASVAAQTNVVAQAEVAVEVLVAEATVAATSIAVGVEVSVAVLAAIVLI